MHFNLSTFGEFQPPSSPPPVIYRISGVIKCKSKVYPITSHESPEGEIYSSTLPSNSALDGVRWLTPSPGRFTPGKDPVPIVQKTAWAPGTFCTGAENPAPTGIRSPDRPACSESLYRLSYPGPHFCRQKTLQFLGRTLPLERYYFADLITFDLPV